MTVGDRIKRRRSDLHLTQDEVASKVGTIKQTIYKYEQNKITNIPTDMIAEIAQALETTPAYLMGWDEPKKEEPVPVDSPRIRDGLCSQGKVNIKRPGIAPRSFYSPTS